MTHPPGSLDFGGITPGPWHVPAGAPWQVVPDDGSPGDVVIARVFDKPTRSQAEAEANARLMAAAPELLEVLLSAAPFLHGNPVAAGVLQRFGWAMEKVDGE
jgi:hypothetical protein